MDGWSRTHLSAGSIINVVSGKKINSSHYVVDNHSGFVVLWPDILVSSTLLADSFSCMRRSVLSDRVKKVGSFNKALVNGKILHEVFQKALVGGDFSEEFLFSTLSSLVTLNLDVIYLLDMDENTALQELKSFIPNFINFWKEFISQTTPNPQPASAFTSTKTLSGSDINVTQVLDIEENIWSPKYGLKGKIDVSARTSFFDKDLNCSRKTVSPIELKTGKPFLNLSHTAQTSLYSLMMSDRYDIDVFLGILYYCKGEQVYQVKAARSEFQSMIMGRNEMAVYMNEKNQTLPPMLKNEFRCKYCFDQDTCFVYHKTLEGGTRETSALGDLFDSKTSFITEKHSAFFRHWENLITLEEKQNENNSHELWTMGAVEREKKSGKCLANLVLLESISETGGGICGYYYKLGPSKLRPKSPLNLCQLASGDSIVVSTMNDHYAVAIGYLTEINPEFVIVGVDRSLTAAFKRCRDFSSISAPGVQDDTNIDPKEVGDILCRIDKEDPTGSSKSARFNLISLFTKDGDENTRSRVVDLSKPQFYPHWRQNPTISETHHDIISKHIDASGLNVDQKAAINQVLCAKDYSLILGMPGTGKTTTISRIIEVLIAAKKTVLVTSYTHSAVDTILLKLKSSGIDFLRLGNEEKVHRDIKGYLPSTSNCISETKKKMEKYLQTSVIGTTCLGVNHPLILNRKFDFCIIDEASQITLPVCLGPLRFASQFVLVGDHFQLPPVIRNEEARRKGLETSLFKYLSERHPESMVSLKLQYRMNAEIMSLSNSLIYDGRLKCASAEVSCARMKLDIESLKRSNNNWLADCLFPKKPVLFINTDALNSKEMVLGEELINECETHIIHELTKTLLNHQVSPSDIGIIAPYRSQVTNIQRELSEPSIECNTVDKYQGRDKLVTMVSFVRSNDVGTIGEIIADKRRLNVALTRAKYKLILVGSRKTLSSSKILAQLLNMLADRKCIYDLKPQVFQNQDIENITPDRQHIAKKNRMSGMNYGKSRLVRPLDLCVVENNTLVNENS